MAETEGPGDSSALGIAQQEGANVFKFLAYVKRVVTTVLEDAEAPPPSLAAALQDPAKIEAVKKFIADTKTKALLLRRISVKDEEEGEGDESVAYEISNEVIYTSSKVTSVVLLKRGLIVEADKAFSAQIKVLVLGEWSPYETLHSYLSGAMSPFFKSFIKESGKGNRESDKMAPSVEKKMAELELGLLNLQQNIEIPEITLVVHPIVSTTIKTCAVEKRRPRVTDLGDKVEDSNLLNALQNGVNRWIREIQKVTKLDRDPASGTAMQEVSFWINLERALNRIQEKRDSPEVTLTLDILKSGKRFHATVSFDTNTGLKAALDTVNNYSPLMKDFPLHDLLAATELERLQVALQAIFTHLKKIRNTTYPIQRCLRLVEAISRDLMDQMLKVLGTRRLMHIPFEEFEKVMGSCFDVLSTWEDEYEKLQALLRELLKKKREEHLKMVWRINPAHKRLQIRLEQMRKFRQQHDQLCQVIVRVLRPVAAAAVVVSDGAPVPLEGAMVESSSGTTAEGTDTEAIKEVNLAYENVKEVESLDVSKEGTVSWEAAIKRYDERIDRVEARITAQLRDQLGTARNANEMFRIFSRYNALFVRPHIRGAIREYQTQLIQRVKDDIESLHEKFKVQYPQSKACRMSRVRDLPPVAGSIVWARQIELQLEAYLRRVEDVLGKGWESHVEGQALKQDGESFRLKLNTAPLFEDWCRKVQQKSLGVTGNIFMIESQRARQAGGSPTLHLKVNFHPEIITLQKEVRNFKWLHFRVPLAIVNKAHEASQLYPSAVSLIESVRTFERACEKAIQGSSGQNTELLLAGQRREAQHVLRDGCSLVWESYKLQPYVQRLAETTLIFQERVEELLVVDEMISAEVRSLETCAYSAHHFSDILSRIQKAVDDLSLHNYSNLPQWVSTLDEEVEKRLAYRLELALRAWSAELQKGEGGDEDGTGGRDRGSGGGGMEISMDTEASSQGTQKLGGEPKIRKLVHELRIANQAMFLYPPVEDARAKIIRDLFAWEAVVTSLPRITSKRYQVGIESQSDSLTTYRRILAKLPGGQGALDECYATVEAVMGHVEEYVLVWLRYQSLWDLRMDSLYEKLGVNIKSWMATLEDIKHTRRTFDTSEVRKTFGPVCIEFGKVQSKVSLKYDSWHKDVLSKFGALLGNRMNSFHAHISKARGDLEIQSVDTSNTSDAVLLITHVQKLKRKVKTWDKLVSSFSDGQHLLERQRYQFPSTWMYSDNIAGEWSAFSDIMQRKEGSIQTQLASLQAKVGTEDKQVAGVTHELLSEWERDRPVQGEMPPDVASKALVIFEGKFDRLKERRDHLAKAMEALKLTDTGASTHSDERVTVAMEELQDLKGVWGELAKVWEQIFEMKDRPWLSVSPRKLRTQIDDLRGYLKDLPARLRQYASFEFVKKTLANYAKVNVLVTELKSDAVKERHWRSLMRTLGVRWILAELTLGNVWDIDLVRSEKAVRDVLMVAQGERALEEFLKQVSEHWRTYELELISYQNKSKLIRGWDDLFNKVKEHLNSVGAMKLSPYYKEFEEDALAWEDRLNRIHDLFDVWIDVQRRWVYLEGIFTGSADIKQLLPIETSRFHSVSTEFLGLMKKVTKSPLVMDVVNIANSQKQLERLSDLLSKIQKALGEYLERERASFPRFYFVGDEDLLEIIGNSKNIPRLQKHFKKMFAGITAILLNEDNSVVNGIASKEGEEVAFHTPVVIAKHPKINEWLTQVEREMRNSLARLLAQAVQGMAAIRSQQTVQPAKYMEWIDQYQAQLVVLASQISWSESVDAALSAVAKTVAAKGVADLTPLKQVLTSVDSTLNVLADSVLHEQPAVRRRKLEHLIMESVHQRDVTRSLIKKNVDNPKSFEWLCQMRFYFDPKNTEVLQQLSIHMANAKFQYGFEYLGVQEKLVQTPLTDRCYLTMTQALEARLGGSPFGPAGTGKTESVKALGNQLGRFVLVFNCDETFDFQAMGRIFVGLCQVGAWGCFDEFNRLEERMLSACSQQIQTIQEALKERLASGSSPDKKGSQQHMVIELVGKQVKVNPDMAIFITMNPGYAGRSQLPDNLKQLFRSLAMTAPEGQLIAQVMLYSQGFRTAEVLSNKIVPFFKLCDEQLSSQSHYDFGLRALKSVLISAGNVKRERILRIKEDLAARGEPVEESKIAEQLPEQEILIQSVMETMVPKLVAEDIPLLNSLLSDVFPGVQYTAAQMGKLRDEITRVCEKMHLVHTEQGAQWTEKVLQLYQITQLHHGLMMVGPSGSGKSSAWRVLLEALERVEGVEGVAHVIDPKSISKESLYGSLDPNTREWTDGLFTHILRRIIDNVRGEINKRQWIVFDGDVDPEWVENLNSVLDNTKLLTLPNGERLAVPPNVRIMFEVQDLKYATLATVSRCGMVWFSEDVLATSMIFDNFLSRLRSVPLEEGDEVKGQKNEEGEEELSPALQVQRDAANVLSQFLTGDGLVVRCLERAATMEHVMDFTRLRALSSLFSMLNEGTRNVITYNNSHSDFPMEHSQLEQYISKWLVLSILWSFTGDGKLKLRQEMGEYIRGVTTIPLPPVGNLPIIDYEVTIEGTWRLWSSRVPQIEVETHKVAAPDVVVPTVDTVRHESLLYMWLAEHKPLVLCGPPGSGKTMTLFSALRALPDMEVVGLNFSSATTPELMLKTFDHYCEYKRTPNGVVLSPLLLNKWLVLFCDEINLPNMDKYGTQRVISFMRQIVEHGGFYRTSDQTWVKLERIQFVGACNPPTDPGRKPLSHRFLRHVPVVYVDYPGQQSLCQIYGTFNRAMLRLVPSLRAYADPLTNAMVDFYLKSQERFTQDMQPHYIYSPREMSRWVRGICEALRPVESLPVEGLVRIWAHEALRLFQDRLVEDCERNWTDENIDAVALHHFPNIDRGQALTRPILYSNWLSKDYVPVDQEELREYVKARLKVFYEEELDVPLVLFNEVLDHVLRIDRIFRQPQGHLLLIGVSGAGKTTLSRFVAWMNGLSIFQIKVHNKYSAEDFDEDLRKVLRRTGCRKEKVAFILDESNIMDSGFLERMNTLLANGEVPGLFEGDEYGTLMTQCKEGAQREGLMLDSQEELYRWFTQQVMNNLHVVFTMNPSSEGLKDRAATSPALFNRCVLNWFGDWSNGALYQVALEFTNRMDLENNKFVAPEHFPSAYENLSETPSHREAIINALVYVHQSLYAANERVVKRGGMTMAVTPRHYLDFINHYVKLFNEKRSDLEEQQLHLNVGLSKIRETVDQVEELQKSLSIKRRELEEKNAAANLKLKEMLADQQEAEKRKVTSQEIHQELQIKQGLIAVKKEEVMKDLAQVEPAVIDAQQAVKSIKKQQLVEVRALHNPPPAIKLAMEAVATMLGETNLAWKTLRGVIMRDNFISTIVNFRAEDILDEVREKLVNNYLSSPDFTFEKVNRASLACGPLVKWAIAQINYADMIRRVDPLRRELQSLQDDSDITEARSTEMDNVIVELEQSINRYKAEYAQLIGQAQAIKAGLEAVETKVGRSVALLDSLAQERSRWEDGSEGFKLQMSTICGDVLLSAAFLAYAGYFDQNMRGGLFTNWSSQLQQSNLAFRADLARIEYLANADDRLKWHANSLPSDDLCTENAIMLKRFNRYPLIIDPSGQATTFLLNEYRDRKITKTSFLDDAFRKNLESALRFGNPLLVQDVENYDPILNPVLNRELRRTGGRVLITLGDQDIDLSPSFTIFLSTRDPTVEFPPDVCSRVTFVNFTVTRASLQSQCLNQVLLAERPDVDKKRSDLLKLQGEFQLRLRQLEKSLLQSLNDVKGRILDDDSIITNLETLKTEAGEVARKVEETDVVMAEVDRVSEQYVPLSQSCSYIYFTLEGLNQVHFLYQFSLQFFLDIFSSVLRHSSMDGVKGYDLRLKAITRALFQMTYDRVARGQLHNDRVIFAILLCRIYLKQSGQSRYDAEFQHFLSSQASLTSDSGGSKSPAGLNLHQQTAVADLAKLTSFTGLSQRVQSESAALSRWLTSMTPESSVLPMWQPPAASAQPVTPFGEAMYRLLVIQALRPDRLVAMTHLVVQAAMGEHFEDQAQREPDLAVIVQDEIAASVPILMCSAPGYDASGRVMDLAAQLGKQLTDIAIGSAEGFSLADKAINSATKSGRWVMLKNVHLAPQWLVQLEKKLHSLQPAPNFRLFLTMEIHPKLPVNLLRAGRSFVFEPPPGVRANLLRTFNTVPATRMARAPSERSKLYFLLAWFHAIVQERLTYAPLGWSKKYEFSESDLKCACDTLDTWIDSVSMGRTNLPPEKVPWGALRALLSQCIYGGKIDNEFDQRLLDSFVNKLFTVGTFDNAFALVSSDDSTGGAAITIPDGMRREQFLQWADNLTQTQTPSWLGLPNNAEKLLLTNRGADMIANLLKMQMMVDEEEELAYSSQEAQKAARIRSTSSVDDGRPQWMRALHKSVDSWLRLVPQSLTALKRSAENIKDPLFRFFEREVNAGSRLLSDIRRDLQHVALVCEAEKKPTNYLRQMMSDLTKAITPESWRRYSVPAGLTVIQWITDFSERIRQLQAVSQASQKGGTLALKKYQVWLGGLFIPEAYITATRQYVAQANSWSLEELYLQVTVPDGAHAGITLDDCSFGCAGLIIQGASCSSNRLALTSDISTTLPLTSLSWRRIDPANPHGTGKVNLPVYLNSTRSQLLFTLDFDVEGSPLQHSFYERGVALVGSKL